ncbi:hypothetical protein, conserved [Leishmania lindenbergi]|uniref:Cytochrome c domain-containing protein n=1 Tax=Leishmania lindenbergi TaxID=651832 RepID=A0AAW3A8C8_9TRYP
MYTTISSAFAAWATVGAHRGNWRTRVANSWIGTQSSSLYTPSSACLTLHPAVARTTRTAVCRQGGGAVLDVTASDMDVPRGQQFSVSVQRLLWGPKAPSPEKMMAVLTEQHMTGVALSVVATTGAASVATRMRRSAALDAVTASIEMLGDTGVAIPMGGAPQPTKRGSPAATSPNGGAASTGTARQNLGSPAATPTCDSSSLPLSSTETLVARPPARVFSFRGNPHELQDCLRGAKVLVFFYKTSCAPCTAIRSKLLHAVAGAGVVGGGGATATPPTSTVFATEDSGIDGSSPPLSAHLQLYQNNRERPTRGLTTAPVAADTEATDAAAVVATTATMTVEEQKACNVACRFLGGVAKPFPHSVILLMVDTNANAEVTALHDIRSLPTFMAYRNGCIIGRFEGSHEDEINKLVDLLTQDSAEGSPTTDNEKASQQQQQQGTTSSPVSGDYDSHHP